MVIEMWTVVPALDVCAGPEFIGGAVDKVAIEVVTESAEEVTDRAVETISQHRL